MNKKLLERRLTELKTELAELGDCRGSQPNSQPDVEDTRRYDRISRQIAEIESNLVS